MQAQSQNGAQRGEKTIKINNLMEVKEMNRVKDFKKPFLKFHLEKNGFEVHKFMI